MKKSGISDLAGELNSVIQNENNSVFSMLSDLGKKLYFPKGILSQSAEASAKAKTYNATIGIATEKGKPMGLGVVMQSFNGMQESEILPYAPATGLMDLRKVWMQGLKDKNPSLANKSMSLPVVTSGVTHGLSVAADLFTGKGDVLLVPDKFWENYQLVFGLRRGAELGFYSFFTEEGGFNLKSFERAVKKYSAKKKIVTILNFPNNPTGYTPSLDEARKIVEILHQAAKRGVKIVAIADDAYFGLFYEPQTNPESIFASLADLHENILAVKVDGPTKELYAWGFRCGFITLSTKGTDALYGALEKKIAGCIRANISNCSLPSQSVILKAIKSPDFASQFGEKKDLLKIRAQKVKTILETGFGKEYWDFYPFNSGYFMCLRLKRLDADTFRKHLLDQYGVGVISDGKTDIRVAFSSVEAEKLEDLFGILRKAASELSSKQS